MAFTAYENFDSYTDTAELQGMTGGTGWTTAWYTYLASFITTVTAPAGGQGGLCAQLQGYNTASRVISREFTAYDAGVFTIRIRSNNSNLSHASAIKLWGCYSIPIS
jgi:hypothetical protein